VKQVNIPDTKDGVVISSLSEANQA